jgi:hypothetical protein
MWNQENPLVETLGYPVSGPGVSNVDFSSAGQPHREPERIEAYSGPESLNRPPGLPCTIRCPLALIRCTLPFHGRPAQGGQKTADRDVRTTPRTWSVRSRGEKRCRTSDALSLHLVAPVAVARRFRWSAVQATQKGDRDGAEMQVWWLAGLPRGIIERHGLQRTACRGLASHGDQGSKVEPPLAARRRTHDRQDCEATQAWEAW